MSTSSPSSLELRGVSVTIDQQEILRHLDLSIMPGEMFVVLGCAGSGKTTLLRAIAGLDPLLGGEIWIDEHDITRCAERKRGIAMMMADFPLWPNLNVSRNVGFPLKRQGLRRPEVQQRTAEILSAVGLNDFHRHMPAQLGNGQQQRVALARTLVANARITLLDEPFSAQHLRTRDQLLILLKRRQEQSALTTLFATEDPKQALRLADRIAILHHGELQQIGTPRELYDAPDSRLVAEFLGRANLIEGEIEYAGDQPLFHANNGIVIPVFERQLKRARTGWAMFRPHDLHVVAPDSEPFGDDIRLSGRIEQKEFRGGTMRRSCGRNIAQPVRARFSWRSNTGMTMPLFAWNSG